MRPPEQGAFEEELKERKRNILFVLQPLTDFCGSPSNKETKESRSVLNSLLEKQSIKTIEELDLLLEEQDIKSKKYFYTLQACRLLSVKYTNNPPHF